MAAVLQFHIRANVIFNPGGRVFPPHIFLPRVRKLLLVEQDPESIMLAAGLGKLIKIANGLGPTIAIDEATIT